jgi:hypothetical protein
VLDEGFDVLEFPHSRVSQAMAFQLNFCPSSSPKMME